jgi:hypothetical protein
MKHLSAIFLFLAFCNPAPSWSQTIPADYTPVYRYSSAITGWASSCVVLRGPVRADDPEAGFASFGMDKDGTGPADNVVVSLGDGGMAILSFSEPVINNVGPDFAVFENSFDGKYLELAFVEVSSDSIRWVRFPSVSETRISSQVGTFGTLDPGMIHNLAGKHPVMFGTPFCLEDVADSAGLDVNNVKYVRIIDVVGSINPDYASYDSYGNIINDPWPTPFPQSGFDLDAVAVVDISLVGIEDPEVNSLSVYPVPASDFLYIKTGISDLLSVRVVDTGGRIMSDWYEVTEERGIPIGYLSPGVWLLEIRRDLISAPVVRKFIRK